MCVLQQFLSTESMETLTKPERSINNFNTINIKVKAFSFLFFSIKYSCHLEECFYRIK